MNLSRLFILRPVATTLSMLAIVLAGLIAYRLLPVSALPQVDYPTIRVMTLYPGASPDVMTSAVTAPLERQFGQMPGLTQMASTSSGGASVLTLRFNLDVNMDVAEQQVQAAINAATNLLPKDLPAPPVYNKVNPADTPVLTLAITSKTMLLPKLNDLVDTRMAQKIAQISGVGMVSIAGGQRQAVRIKVNPEALAANGLNLSDVRTLITASNVNQPKGNFDGPTRVSMLDANDQLVSPEQYAELILAYSNGAPLRLKDVAQIVDGAENERLAAWANENQAVLLNIQRQPGANVIEVVDRIKALLPSITDNLPAGLEVTVLTDRTQKQRAITRSSVPFDVNYITFKIVDKKVMKRTAIQEQVVFPLRAYNYVTRIAGKKSACTVFAMSKFTIPDDKCLVVELCEQNGGRHQSFVIENEDLVRAKVIDELKVQ